MIRQFLEYEQKVKNLSPNTVRAYGNDLTSFCQWLQATHTASRWGAVTKDDIERYVIALHDAKKKPATIRRHIAAIRCMYHYFMKKGLLTSNPARYIESPKLRKTQPSTISTEALESYIDDTANPLALRALIALLYETGLRISEATAIDTKDVDPKTHSIRIHAGKGLKTRTVFYGNRTRRILNEYLGARRGVIFQGASACQREIRYQIWKALNEHVIGERQASPHIIRHTFAMQALNNGMPLTSLQAILGHENPKSTEIYAQATINTQQRDYEKAVQALA